MEVAFYSNRPECVRRSGFNVYLVAIDGSTNSSRTAKGYSIKRFHDPCKSLILSCVTLSLKIRPKRFNMGATCAKCCLCYCFKLCEFGERFRCCPCCIHNCGPCCQFGDCCDVEGDSLPFVEASENLKEEDAVVYTDRDKNIGEMKNDKRYGYGEIICKDSSR